VEKAVLYAGTAIFTQCTCGSLPCHKKGLHKNILREWIALK
jgi:hypothetical protein